MFVYTLSHSFTSFCHILALGSLSSWAEDLDTTEGCNSKYLDVSRVTEPGHTLLWDLIQDDTAVSHI